MNDQDFVDPGKTTPGIETVTDDNDEHDSTKDSTTAKQEDSIKIKSELLQATVEDENNESIANTTHDSIVVADTTLDADSTIAVDDINSTIDKDNNDNKSTENTPIKSSFSIEGLTRKDTPTKTEPTEPIVAEKEVQIEDTDNADIDCQAKVDECIESLLLFAQNDFIDKESENFAAKHEDNYIHSATDVFGFELNGLDILLEGIEKMEPHFGGYLGQPLTAGGYLEQSDGLELLCYLTRNDTFEYQLNPSISR